MVNILIPSMGKSTFFEDSFFPKPLIEIKGKTMLETVIENYSCIDPKNYIFVFDDKDCSEFHLDASAKILSDKRRALYLPYGGGLHKQRYTTYNR